MNTGVGCHFLLQGIFPKPGKLWQWRIHLQRGDANSIPWVRKIPWRRERQPTPDFCLENPMDRGTWQAIGMKLQTVRHNWVTKHTHTQTLPKTVSAHLSKCDIVLSKVKVAQSCPILRDPMDYSPPGSSVHGIFQARILEWVAIPSPGDLPNPGIEPRSPALQADSLLFRPPGKPNTIYTCVKVMVK